MREPVRPPDEAQDAPKVAAFESRWRLLAAFAAAAALFGTVGSVHRAGLWDPHELETAELARRIAAGLLGAPELWAPEDGGVPTRGELGRGELPFTAVALGFRLFGLSAPSGRFPLALFAVAGLAALFWMVRRLAGKRAACLSVLALSTMPLYFLHARTMLGDIVAMAASSGAMAGLGLAVFGGGSLGRRIPALLLGCASLAAGFGVRGVLAGVALPMLGVGTAWLAAALGRLERDRYADPFGGTVLALGIALGGVGAHAVETTPSDRYSMLVGALIAAPRPALTFDLLVRDIGHALFPWSALLPWAVGRLLAPPVVATGASPPRVHALRLVLLASAAVALLGETLIAPYVGRLAYGAPAALAGIVALALHDLDLGAGASRAFGLCVAAIGIVLLLDYANFPETTLAAFAAREATFPVGFTPHGFLLLGAVTVSAFALFVLLVEEPSDPFVRVFRRDDYLAWPRTLWTLWRGNLLFAALVSFAALLALELFGALGARVPALRSFAWMGELPRMAVRFGWMALLACAVLPLVAVVGRDAVRVLTRPFAHWPTSSERAKHSSPWRWELGRGASAAVALSAIGAVLSFQYYPELMNQLSPKETLDAYRQLRRSNDVLGVYGVAEESVRYHAGAELQALATPEAAARWLREGTSVPNTRRFLLFPAAELAPLNSEFRAARTPATNLPIVGPTAGDTLLAVNALDAGERNQNPLRNIVLDKAPAPTRELDADLAGKVHVLGWDVLDATGAPVSSLVPGFEYEFVIYYQVVARLVGSWSTFIHIDGFQRRYNGDHVTTGGRYPNALWRAGDYIADRHTILLEPNFGPGAYEVYIGMFRGERRLDVRRGAHDGNRIIAGTLTIR